MLPILVTLQYVADTKNSIVDRLTREEKGATAVEYGLIVGLMAVIIVAAFAILGPKINTLFSDVSLTSK
ncbi:MULTISPECIES: Flp family type IVb pilin [Kocuria]|uniref:Flp family type IVb pilin n=1 Tax=Kocuria TaxID=57493 RepID=UPI002540516F|nr:Flp family type IVb pilin [Kocuria rosea]WIG18097.1 Flp family type IVb pilin [Kocuria rosea]